MSHPRIADLEALIRALVAADIRFIVVGGAAAVLHGAPVTTQDLDIVHETSPENVQRFARLLSRLDALVRQPGDRRIRPTEELLAGAGQLDLSTSLGPLDLLCRLHDGRSYADLIGKAEVVTDGEVEIRILDLTTLIDIRSTTGRAKDKLSLPILIALLRERESGGE